ncbi:MAG: tRNA pseudouridine(38-40) synthase TruA [candidate division Zixibacteria bacterium]|nr:tRNA pseudouridine(38-40) synthase TruA [candidate division Zixibacteria bacterium]
MNIRLDIQYKGTDFSGWQFQPNEVTVQGEIEKTLAKVTGQKIAVYGAGRTDAGVHALGQVANFRIEHHLPPEKYKDALNFYLPKTILIMKSSLVPDDFHARKSAHWRHYRYIIDRERTALYFEYRWEYPFPLDKDRMNTIAEYIKGRHDFEAFCTISSLKDNNECEIYSSGWIEKRSLLIYEIRANRFLHSMVRSLVGLMIEAGKNNDYLTLEQFRDIMKSGNHAKIGNVAPARGLYLVAVGY